MIEGQALRIGELARRAGISTSRVRFYEARGLLADADRQRNGYRSYGPRDLKILSVIVRATALGFTLGEVRDFLHPETGERPSPQTLLPRLQAKLRQLDDHMNEVRRRRREILELIDELRTTSQALSEPSRADTDPRAPRDAAGTAACSGPATKRDKTVPPPRTRRISRKPTPGEPGRGD